MLESGRALIDEVSSISMIPSAAFVAGRSDNPSVAVPPFDPWPPMLASLDALNQIEDDEDSGARPPSRESMIGVRRFLNQIRNMVPQRDWFTACPTSIDATTWGTIVLFWESGNRSRRIEIYNERIGDEFVTIGSSKQYRTFEIAGQYAAQSGAMIESTEVA